MASISKLGQETLLLIFEQLHGEGCPTLDLKSVSLVCRHFRKFASTLLFKHMTIRVPTSDDVAYNTSINDPGGSVQFLRKEDEANSKDIPPTSHSVRLLSFFLEHGHEHLRAQIRIIHVCGPFLAYTERDQSGIQVLLERLLPLLPRLRHISISRIGSSRLERPDGPSFLETVENLDRFVTISIGRRRGPGDGYVHTLNPHLILDKVTRLNSLQVSLLNTPQFPRHGGPTYASFDGIPSKDTAKIIHQNPALKHLHLRLGATNPLQEHELSASEIEHALQNVSESIRPLDSLTLEGSFLFPLQAWSIWDSKEVWIKLRSLSILAQSLMQDLTTRLTGRCSDLRSLRLDDMLMPPLLPHNAQRFQTDVTTFVSSLNLNELMLVGLHPNNLSALKDAGSNVRHLLFHIREGPTLWAKLGPFQIRSPNWKEIILSTSHLEDLRTSCPQLEWLAFDTMPFHVDWQLRAPLPGHSNLALLQISQNAAHLVRPIDIVAQRTILKLQHPTEDELKLDNVFTTLTRFHSLRHLRLFVHSEPLVPWTFSLADTMRTFLWLRRNKGGATLQSLVVYASPHARVSSPWIVYDMGEVKLCTTEGCETIIWEVTESGEFNESQRSVREEMSGKEDFLETWEREDREGVVVPIGWA